MSDLMPESVLSYLRRVVPDVQAIDADVQAALAGSRYALSDAIGKTQKLLEDLQRAERL
jgi:hypothetical protein